MEVDTKPAVADPIAPAPQEGIAIPTGAVAPPPEEPENATETLYIQNLNEKIKVPVLKASLRGLFKSYGEVLDVVAHDNLRMRGQAFVSFESPDIAKKALKEVRGFPLYSKPMQISFARTRSDAVVKKLDAGNFETHKARRMEHKKETRYTNPLKRKFRAKRMASESTGGRDCCSSTKTPAVQMPDEYLPPNKILFLQNLPESVSKDQLMALFSQYPNLYEVRLIPTKKDIAFVEYMDETSATAAKDALHNYKLDGENKIKITTGAKVADISYVSSYEFSVASVEVILKDHPADADGKSVIGRIVTILFGGGGLVIINGPNRFDSTYGTGLSMCPHDVDFSANLSQLAALQSGEDSRTLKGDNFSLDELLKEAYKIPLETDKEQSSHSGVSRESLANTMPERGVDTGDLPSPKRRKTQGAAAISVPPASEHALNHKASNISRTSSRGSSEEYWDADQLKISDEAWAKIDNDQDEQEIEDTSNVLSPKRPAGTIPTTPSRTSTADHTPGEKIVAFPTAPRTVVQTPPSPESPVKKPRQRNVPPRGNPSPLKGTSTDRDGDIAMGPPLIPAPDFSRAAAPGHAGALPTAVPQATLPDVEARYDHLLGDGKLSVAVEIIAHHKDAQREMDARHIAWGVQYELARGVSCDWWKWEDVTSEKLDQLKGNNASAAPRVMKVMMSKDKRDRPDVLEQTPMGDVMALWKEYDREQDAIMDGRGRGLGLTGDWKDAQGWYGGQIQQVVRLTKDMNKFHLESPEMTRSNRFARFLGSRRLLELRVGHKLKYADDTLKTRLAKRFVLCGRVFVPIDSKDGKVYLMETDEDYERCSAPSEGDQQRMSLQDFIAWHNPLSRNYKQVGMVLDAPHDKSGKVPAEKTMTDGCGWINASALIRIAQQLGCTSRPTAVQGRIAGAKGVWLLHPHDRVPTDPPRIWIRDSQNKINLPALATLDRAHLIFDLVQQSTLNAPSRLSMQLIVNLSHNGVPDDVFKELLRKGMEEECSALTKWNGPEAMPLLWDAVNKVGRVTGMRVQKLAGGLSRALGLSRRFDLQDDDDDDEEEPPDVETGLEQSVSTPSGNGGPPASACEVSMMMLQAGFKPQSCGFLHEKLRFVVKDALAAYIKKYRIAVPQSAEAFIVPADPFGVLEEGQIHFQASRELKDPISEMDITRIMGPVLVSRNPARVASDVQKVTAVVHPALFEYIDVIVFSVKGARSLASYLGGGDYDGDVAMITWDQSIVKPFRNHAFVAEPPEIKDSFESDIKQVTEFAGLTPSAAQVPLLKALLAGLGDTKVGKYSKFNDNVVYALGYNHPKAVRLAYMFTTCLDAKKTGLRLKQDVVRADFKEYDAPKPDCMKSDDFSENEVVDNRVSLRRRRSLPRFVLDSLLATGQELQTMHLQKYAELDTWHGRPDPDLLSPIEKALAVPNAMIKEEVKLIRKHVEASQQGYGRYWTTYKPTSKKGKSNRSAALFHDKVRKPYAEGPDVPVVAALSNLDELRASDTYKYAMKEKKEKFAFEVAFKALCTIKARAVDSTPMSQQFANIMQMQSAAVRVLRNAQNGNTV
ncbi:hypothetical protein EWM64_g6785 [Hericium alpestre]|uniref:RRM domain-containing protein n=1 Tax=Hericium alpestre TaxID=135208 RepID=A0A4Y9ZUR1_9AGAM|nr:hypothetical protein EWM64_g6785 [Hericium alpestre]